MRSAVAAGLLFLSLALAPTTLADDPGDPNHPTDGLVPLYAHWQGPVAASFGGTVVLDERFPESEPDLSEGPLAPGATSADTLPHFTYALTTWFGDQGPLGTLHVDPSRPAVLTLFVSADQTAWPSIAGSPPVDVDAGVAPKLTVEVTLAIGDEHQATRALTKDLVSLPGVETVHRYDVVLPLARTTIEPGEGLFADVTLYQLDANGERVVQNLFNLHTGEAHPTGLALPLVDDRGLYLPDDVGGPTLVDDLVEASGVDEADPEAVRTTAAAAFGAAIGGAALSGVQLVRQWRR